MGEEKKEFEEKKNEEKEKEKKKNDEKEEKEIVIKVEMHCQACARKVARSLKGFQGVEEVCADSKKSKVVVKGKTADPIKVCERIEKKTGKKVELVSPLPAPEDQKKEETKDEPKQEEIKKEEAPLPAAVTIVLKVGMHCEACAQVLQKRIRKIPGVESAAADLANEQVTVKGIVDPDQLVNEVYKRTKKQASIVVKNEEKKEGEEKKKKKDEDKKEEKEGEMKEDEEQKGEEETKTEIKKYEYYPPPKYQMEHAYAPQFFSDENPNACSVM